MQERTSFSINLSDTFIGRSNQLDNVIPASKIAGLSSGAFVGMVADDPDSKIDLQSLQANIQNYHLALKTEQEGYKAFPIVQQSGYDMVQWNYLWLNRM